MTNNNPYVKQNFIIECRGRNEAGEEVLDAPIRFNLKISQSPTSNEISSDASNCPYNTGGHGQRCKAAVPIGQDKVKHGATCPYSFDIPYALEKAQQAGARR